MDYMGQDLGFSAGKPEGDRVSSETLEDTGRGGGGGRWNQVKC